MATKRWVGNSLAVAQVSDWLFGGTWEADDVVKVTINGKVLSVTAGSTTLTTVVDNVVTAYNASSIPEFAEMTASRSGNNFRLTADTAGKPFPGVTLTTTEAGGGAADLQTIAAESVTTASSGPNHWDTAANWDTGTVPVNTDDVFIENSNVSILYGLAQSAVTLTSLNIAASFTGTIGLPRYTASNGYAEYRDQYLAIGATTFNHHTGPGNGSGRVKINFGTAQVTANIYGTGQSLENGVESLILKGTHASNQVNAVKGNIGIAIFPGETATIDILRSGFVTNALGDVTMRLGSGVTIGTRIDMSGGSIAAASAVPILNMTDGVFSLTGTAGITTVNGDGGTFYHQSTGTITTLNVGDGFKADFTRDMRGRTITNCNLYSGFKLIDSFGTCTFTNPIALVRCGLSDGELDLGVDFHLQPSA